MRMIFYWNTQLYDQPENYINQIFQDILKLFNQQIFDLDHICKCFQVLEVYSSQADIKRQQKKYIQGENQKMARQGKTTKVNTIRIGQQTIKQNNNHFSAEKARRQNQKRQIQAIQETSLKKYQHFFNNATFRSMILMYSTILLEKIIKYEIGLLLQPRLYQKYWFIFTKVFSSKQLSPKSNQQSHNNPVIFMENQSFNFISCYPIIDYLIKYRKNVQNSKQVFVKILQGIVEEMKANEQFCKRGFDNQDFIKTLKKQYQSQQNESYTKQLILNIFQEMDNVYKKYQKIKVSSNQSKKLNQKNLEIQFNRIAQMAKKPTK